MAVEPLPTLRAAELEATDANERWLIQQLWTRAAVGFVSGAPKSTKSWMVLEMATCVAAGAPCLGRFPVDDPGPALVYLAEDSLGQVRHRIASLCAHRGIELGSLPLHVITAPALRLDLADHQERLESTVARLRPRLLVLDPLVRLHRACENDASEMSALLGFLRELQRACDVAIALVHHTTKKRHGQGGIALRGSSDLWAFTDSSAYLVRRDDRVVLTSEHRSARAPEPLTMKLVSEPDGDAPHLEIVDDSSPASQQDVLAEAVLEVLGRTHEPLTRQGLRERLRVNNQRLGDALDQLQRDGIALRTSAGWTLPAAPR